MTLLKKPQITQITQIFTRLKFAVIRVIRVFFQFHFLKNTAVKTAAAFAKSACAD